MRRHTPGLSAALLLAAAAATPACEDVVTVSGTITVPLEVQQLFSAEQPGKLALTAGKLPSVGPLPYLCAATDGPLVLGYQFTSFGCAEEQEIQVRAFRVKEDHLAEVRCGETARGSSGGLPGEELAYGATVIFSGRSGTCESGNAVANVTLNLTLTE